MKKTVIYSILTVLLIGGIVSCEMVMQFSSVLFLADVAFITFLMRYAGKKETSCGRKIVVTVLAVLLVFAIFWVFNEIYGNPITKNVAKEAVEEYLEAAYPEKMVHIESVSHNMSAGSYEAWIAGADGGFTVVWRDGKILYDTYEGIQ